MAQRARSNPPQPLWRIFHIKKPPSRAVSKGEFFTSKNRPVGRFLKADASHQKTALSGGL